VEQLEGIAQQLGAAMQRISSKAALEKLHRQYELILNSAWEGIMGLDPNGNHTFVNPAAARMLGYEVGELIGRHSHSTWHHTRADGSPYPAEECPIYEAFQKRRIQHMTDEHFIRKDGTSFVVEAISTPIQEDGDISGTVVTFWDITRRKQGEKALKDSMERMRRIMDGTVKALASAVETRDPYTAGHQIRVATLASAIAGEMGLSADQIEGIKIAAILHDIGKIGVPAEILSKPGRLTDTEYNLIKGHSQAGCEIFAGIDFPFPVTQIVAQHHERLDGSGYPCGLEGHDIILGARILAVADVVEAMASHRPYRPALGIEAALEEITKHKDILYDPEVAEACTKLFQEKGYTLD
jgi:PAS domain S-box-containing protein/putative nucleotidyltransferase with HDIG domain